ncbi:NAD-dependent epimerase/dehydratase [Corchorus olitorius]|uniref:NAD-dependent epimerase/dehydratase n=1 Tax=Corchorus olitorius TaxID=93759 RepID=A0A1R3K0J3_9ROSI|nr:NAD-dependent epimerase/dehydratase [Corchorus olitorius]
MSKQMSHLDNIPSTPGKFKMDKSPYIHNRLRWHSSLVKLTFWSFIFLGLILIFFFRSPSSNPLPQDPSRRSLRTYNWGGPSWEKRVRSSARVRSRNGISVLVTGAAGFVGTHVSAALKRRGDGVLGLDNFNDYYDPSLKRARQALLERTGVFIVEGDINDSALLRKLFEVVAFTHVMHLAAQAGVRDILKGKSIPIFEAANHGTVARDFTYIDDIVKGCLGALDTAEKSTGSGGKKKGPAQLRVYNLGNTSPVPVSDLVSILERLLKVNAKRNIMKLPRNGDVQFTHANISLAQRELGYKPTTDLQTGLKKFVRWYLSYYSGGKKAAG